MCYDKKASLALFLKGEFTMSEKDEITVIGFCESEYQRKDGRYRFRYIDEDGKKKCI